MEYQKAKIDYYRQRTFSEKLNATFDFIRGNWKPLLKYTFYLIMPICLIQTLAMNSVMSNYFGVLLPTITGGGSAAGMSFGFLANYGIVILCSLAGSAIISGMTYAMMQAYETRENGLRHVTLNDFKENLVTNAWKCVRIILSFVLVYAVIMFIVALLAAASVVSLFVTIPLVILAALCFIPLMMLMPVYIFERDIRFFDAIAKAWKLGMGTLAGMVGFLIVLGIISSVIQTITMLPWYLVTIVGHVFSLTAESTMNQSVVFKFTVYILGLIQSYGMYAASTIGTIGLAFQYFHAREKMEGVTVESNISNFNRL
jgi:hypothetical protein